MRLVPAAVAVAPLRDHRLRRRDDEVVRVQVLVRREVAADVMLAALLLEGAVEIEDERHGRALRLLARVVDEYLLTADRCERRHDVGIEHSAASHSGYVDVRAAWAGSAGSAGDPGAAASAAAGSADSRSAHPARAHPARARDAAAAHSADAADSAARRAARIRAADATHRRTGAGNPCRPADASQCAW